MNRDLDRSEFEASPEDELKALEREWDQGRLTRHVERLLSFVATQRGEILSLATDRDDAKSLLQATKHLIFRLGSVHPKSEMLDQISEMQRELWYRGEQGDYDQTRIKEEWTSQHARNWRQWRIKQYLFAADRCAAQIVERIRGV